MEKVVSLLVKGLNFILMMQPKNFQLAQQLNIFLVQDLIVRPAPQTRHAILFLVRMVPVVLPLRLIWQHPESAQ